MPIRIELNHHTHYQYDRMVFLSPQLLRLKPAAHSRTPIESYSMTIEPANHILHWQQDPFGNFIARVDFSGAVQMMAIQIQLRASLEPVNPFNFFIDTYAASFPFDYDAQLKKDLSSYLEVTERGPHLIQWIGQIRHQLKGGTLDFLIALNQRINQSIVYSARMEPGVQTVEETLRRSVGSCRDMAWLLVQSLRKFNLAARFVSGYLVQLAMNTDQKSDSSDVVEDSLALHAWAEVYIPGAGWIGLDPTSGMLTTESHIPLACTPDPASAAPVMGTTTVSETKLTYSSTLVRLNQ